MKTLFYLTAAIAFLPLMARGQTVILTQASPWLQSTQHYVTVESEPGSGGGTGYDAAQSFVVSDPSPSNLSLPSPLTLFCGEIGQDAPGTGDVADGQTYAILPIADL